MGAAACSHARPSRMATISAVEQEPLPLGCCYGAVTGPGSWAGPWPFLLAKVGLLDQPPSSQFC